MENKLLAFGLLVAGLTLNIHPTFASTYSETWSTTQEGPYSSLPEYKTNKRLFIRKGVNFLAQSAQRTLENDSDILPHFQKFVHPVGICFAGTWKVTQKTPYTGYFAEGADGLFIARASEAMGVAKKGNHRAFGIAGKIFPTNDPKETHNYKTANFFTVDDLGGTKSESFLELPKTNEPPLTPNTSALWALNTVLSIVKTFKAADGNPGFRPIDQIAELGLADVREAKSPRFLMLKAITKPVGNAEDFREELRLKNFPQGKLQYSILVAEDEEKNWVEIGKVELTKEALSAGCDHRLHFTHPRLRD